VQKLLDEALSPDVTAEHIQDVTGRARKAKLTSVSLPDGRTLTQALSEAWRAAKAREAATRADTAISEAPDLDAQPPTAPVDDAPAGQGRLPCGCSAAHVAATGDHEEVCSVPAIQF
jgi:hypothetical protein